MTREDPPDVGTVREWWGLARYDPGAGDLDVDRLLAAVPAVPDVGDGPVGADERSGWGPRTPAGLACRTLVQLAETDPDRLVGRLDVLVGHLDGSRIDGLAARAIGRVAAVDDVLLDELLEPLPDGQPRRLQNALQALGGTVRVAPRRVEPAVEDLVWAHGRAFEVSDSGLVASLATLAGFRSVDLSDPAARYVRERTTRILGRLAAVDEETLTTLRELLDDADPARRACGVRALGTVVANGDGDGTAREDLARIARFARFDDHAAVRTAALAGLGTAAAGPEGTTTTQGSGATGPTPAAVPDRTAPATEPGSGSADGFDVERGLRSPPGSAPGAESWFSARTSGSRPGSATPGTSVLAVLNDEGIDLVECVLDLDSGTAETALERICRGDPDTFEAVLQRFVGTIDQWESDRAVSRTASGLVPAVRAGTAAHPDRFLGVDGAAEATLRVADGAALGIVEAAARWHPGELGAVVETLLDWAGSAPRDVDVPAVRRTLAALAPVHPSIPHRLERELLQSEPAIGGRPMTSAEAYGGVDGVFVGETPDVGSDRHRAIPRTIAVVADVAPDALLSAAGANAGPSDPDLVETLQRMVGVPRPDWGVTLALARLGRYDPAVVRPVAEAVADHLVGAAGAVRFDHSPTSPLEEGSTAPGGGRPLFELGGVVARAAPGAVEPVADDLLAELADRPAAAAPAVGFLAGLCVGSPDRVPDVMALLEAGDEAERAVLSAVARAGRECPVAFGSHLASIAARTEGDGSGPALVMGTRALGSVACGFADADVGPEQRPELLESRLVTLVYDPHPEVRRWAAFGLGELAGDGWHGSSPDPDPIERVERIAGRSDDGAAPVARLALLRAGRRPRSEVVADLATVASQRPRPLSAVAVSELQDSAGSDGTDALARVRATASDPVVRRRARESLASR